MTTIILIAIAWYLIGSIGGLWIARKIYPKTTIGDLITFFTIGGVGGMLTFLIGLLYLPQKIWWDKEIF